MPKIPAGNQPVSPAQLLVLRQLAGGAALRSGVIAERAGGAAGLKSLQAAGLVACEALDVDGVTERAWSLTPAGEAVLLGGVGVEANGQATRQPKQGPRSRKPRCPPPIKYHGGKHYLARAIVALMPRHIHYVEPYCFPAGTGVLTSTGWKAIESVVAGEAVMSCKGFGECTATPRRWYEGNMASIKVKGDFRRLQCTPNHPLLCIPSEELTTVRQEWHAHFNTLDPSTQWPRREGSKRHARLTVQRGRAMLNYAKWVPAEDVKAGDFLVYTFDNSASPSMWIDLPFARYGGKKRVRKTKARMSKHIMRLVGLYIAEGRTDTGTVRFTFHEDEKEFIKFVSEQILLLFGASGRVKTREGSRGVEVQFSSRQAVRFFAQFGRGASNKHVPLFWKKLTADRQAYLLQGLFEGDGCMSEDGPVFATVSQRLAQDVFDLLVRQGAMPTIAKSKEREVKLPGGSTYLSTMYRVSVYGQGKGRIASLLGVTGMSEGRRRFVGLNLYGCGTSPYGAPVVIRRVEDVISQQFNGIVYNLTVSGSPSYLTTACTVHNCGGLAVLLARDPADESLWLPPHKGVSEVVNDLDGRLMAFWRVLADESRFPVFRRRVEATPVGFPFWEAARAHRWGADEIDDAVAFFVLCRQSLAGRCKSFSPLTRNRLRRCMNGGASEWLGAVERLEQVHARLRGVVVECRPALEVIQREDGPNSLTYADPPYLPSTRASSVYEFDMTEADHVQLLRVLRACKGKVMLSGYPSTLYDGELKGWNVHRLDLPNNSAGGQKKRRMVECLFMNY